MKPLALSYYNKMFGCKEKIYSNLLFKLKQRNIVYINLYFLNNFGVAQFRFNSNKNIFISWNLSYKKFVLFKDSSKSNSARCLSLFDFLTELGNPEVNYLFLTNLEELYL